MLPYFPRFSSVVVDRRHKPSLELPPNCPRCDSSNTKFCYYNNYSLSQPRFFCKGCRRYWTKGGSLRNVPVGGGCRKSRRPCRTGRTTVPAGADAGSNSGGSLQPDNSLPLDLLLDDPAACSSLSDGGGGGSISSAGEPRPGGADIDLALLYTKFFNQRAPELESGFPAPDRSSPLEVDEPFDLQDAVADSDHPVAVHLCEQSGTMDSHRPELMMAETTYLPSTGEYSTFYLDVPPFCLPQTPSGAEEIILGSDAFWSNCGTVPAAGWSCQQAPSPGMATALGEKEPNPLVGSWNHNFSLAGYEAFPKI